MLLQSRRPVITTCGLCATFAACCHLKLRGHWLAVSSGQKLEYSNSILYSTLSSTIVQLQRVQNSLARVVLQQSRCTPAGPLLRSLHWLPVEQRIQFKLAVLRYKIRTTSHPAYLHRLLTSRVNNSTMYLRSSTRGFSPG